MMATVAPIRIRIVSSMTGLVITLLLVYLLSLSHHFLTRRSESRARISVGSVSAHSEPSLNENPDSTASSLQSALQEMQKLQDVSEVTVHDIATKPKPVDLAMDQSIDFNITSDMSPGTGSGLVEGIPLPMESTPNALFLPGAEFPEKLIRKGVVSGTALLHIRIDTTGHCQILNVIRISNKDLINAVVEAVEKGIFQIPREDGKVREREVLLPITFRANEERVRMIQANAGKP